MARRLSAGNCVTLVFQGGGTAMLAEVLRTEGDRCRTWLCAAHTLRATFDPCAKTFGVRAALDDDHGHSSLRQPVTEAWQVITS